MLLLSLKQLLPGRILGFLGRRKRAGRRNFWWEITVFVDMTANQTRLGSVNSAGPLLLQRIKNLGAKLQNVLTVSGI